MHRRVSEARVDGQELPAGNEGHVGDEGGGDGGGGASVEVVDLADGGDDEAALGLGSGVVGWGVGYRWCHKLVRWWRSAEQYTTVKTPHN